MSSPRSNSTTGIFECLCLTGVCCVALSKCCDDKPSSYVVIDSSRGPADQSFGRDAYGSFGRNSNAGFGREGQSNVVVRRP